MMPVDPGPRHEPVLLSQVLAGLDPRPGQVIVDATVGAGGHAALLAGRLGPEGLLLGLDQDASMLALAAPRVAGCRVVLVERNFEHLRDVLDEQGIDQADAVLADLGFASDQMEDATRGLSFGREGPLDMRLDRREGETAAELLSRLDEHELATLFWRFGEERYSRRIARRLMEARTRSPVETTAQLAELVRQAVPRPKGKPPRIDPATRVFQALRIAVNDELGSLERFLEVLPRCIRPGGKAAIISFHSLEDRLVKRAFRQKETWRSLTRKPVIAAEEEIRHNPRSRSAKLRLAERVTTLP